MSIQTTIPFPVKKKCSFYSKKEINLIQEDFENAALRSTPNNTYTPTTKKLMELSSSDSESDSDVENFNTKRSVKEAKKITNARTPKSSRKTKIDDTDASPPKQSKYSPTTPSTLMSNLKLISSAKKEGKLSPKKLFTPNKYCDARKALHSDITENLPGREAEIAELENFIQTNLTKQTSASLYVSGPPGTGKTASLSQIMSQPKYKSSFKTVYINCTTTKSASAIYGKIIEELDLSVTKSTKNSKIVIEKYLKGKHKMILLILDEIDQLETKNQSVLYSIFEWPSRAESKLILVGIANSLDLTDRLLPRLNAKCELKPKLMHFASYTKQQIENIIIERLKEADVMDVFAPNAIKLLAGKVAAVSGDIRRALDISRRVIELTESKKILQPTNDNDANALDALKANPIDKAADMKDVLDVLNTVFGGAQTMSQDYIFPVQQKIVLCSLLLILNKNSNKDVTVARLHEVYKKVCKKQKINDVDLSEFVGLCSLIETRGIIRVVKKKQLRLSKVNLEWMQKDVEDELKDKALLAEIINDVSCL